MGACENIAFGKKNIKMETNLSFIRESAVITEIKTK